MKMHRVAQQYAVLLIGLTTFVHATAVYSQEVGFSDSNFEIDLDSNTLADQPGVGRIDWNDVDEAAGVDELSGAEDDAFGQGSKEDTPVPSAVTGSIPPNKSDLQRFGLYFENAGLTDKFLHLYWTRVQDPSGTTNMDFEFNQSQTLSANDVTPVRSYLDMLIQYDLENGGTNPQLFLSFWIDGTGGETKANCEAANSLPCWSEKIDLSGADLARGSINQTFIPAADSGGLGDLDPRTFGEATINFGELADVVSGQCVSFGSAYLKSRSSDSFTSSLKDFIAPLSQTVSNCATITIYKEDDDDNALGEGIEFTLYEDDPTIGGTYGDGGDTTVAKTCTTDGSGICIFTNVFPGNYWVVETGGTPTGYDAAVPVPVEVTGPGDDQDLTIENPRLPKLKLVKATVPSTDTGSFVLSDTEEGAMATGGNGTDSGFVFTKTGSHTISEAADVGSDLNDYDSKIVCDSGKGSSDPGTSHTFDLVHGDEVTCTFTNSRLPQLRLTKTLIPSDDSGLFDLIDNSVAKVTDGGDTATSGFYNATTGEHSVDELAGSNGTSLGNYVSSVDCGGKGSNTDGTSNTFDLAYGDVVTCAFTNTRKGTIIVEKLAPDAEADDSFNFTGDVTATLKHGEKSTGVEVSPGTYTATEAGAAGFELTNITCDDANSSGNTGTGVATFNVEAGEAVTCTFTNSRLPQLRLVKATVPTTDTGTFELLDSVIGSMVIGGNGADSDFSFTTTGDHTVSELASGNSSLDDYDASISCDSGKGSGSDSDLLINLDYGDEVTCTFTNTRKGTIIVKKLAPSYASDASFDFTGDVVATLKDGEQSTGFKVLPGTYSSTETVPAGWDLTQISCDDGASASPSSGDTGTGVATFNVEAGETVTCTFTNIPLTDITVEADSLVPGGTYSTISCTPAGGPVEGGNPTLTLPNKPPGTYICTVVVDGGGS